MVYLWIKRRFDLRLPIELFDNVVERVRGTPARIEDKVKGLGKGMLTRRDDDKWSIQEHIGHLLDLDELHSGRVEDFRNQLDILRAADMENKKTVAAKHNDREIGDLLSEFRRERNHFVKSLEELPPEERGRTALHPRLKIPMRVIDMVEFVAEHDDHHLTRMTELMRSFQSSSSP